MAVGKSATNVEIFKPRIDKHEYRRIVISNSLEALLISDPDTDKAAASMVVSVGYFSDPDGLEGLAHFLDGGKHKYKFFQWFEVHSGVIHGSLYLDTSLTDLHP
ncbi:insulin-degrading enzyme-like 2 [Asparagus officinalis]|uniref:insulin-degrading enzyme-like 2 n=1 Tax=Asparagus officinalis TaxID=4686 RepID=UPI00098E69FF|nr:insulin-degrading enzyme-like 2 [Asparagus officinalis]